MNLRDTIAAIATPAGRGGIGIVRLSGGISGRIAAGIVQTAKPLEPWRPVRGRLLDRGGAVIDDVIVTFFEAPRSYTAEDVVEVSCHGSPVVLRSCLQNALANGARLAEPGEFTLRAFLNGRIDLPQAEAIGGLIEATTLHQARIAARQASGSLARELRPAKEQLLELISLLEAGIDFAEDDVSVASWDELGYRLDPIEREIARLTSGFFYGNVLREGFTMAILGRPNVGKSSLFNRLLERDRAIVTEIPGTTRDLVSEVTSIEGIPVKLVDTAGIRKGEGLVESLGIELSFQAMADADLTLVVVDAAAPEPARDHQLIEKAREQGRYLVAVNKIDLCASTLKEGIPVSAKTGQGIDVLREAMIDAVAPGRALENEGAIVTSVRQQTHLQEAATALRRAQGAIAGHIPHEMVLLDLYGALSAMDGLTGKTTADEILNRIFSTFCIGK